MRGGIGGVCGLIDAYFSRSNREVSLFVSLWKAMYLGGWAREGIESGHE